MMYIDRERQARLEAEKADAMAEFERLQSGGNAAAENELDVLRERIERIEEELRRMEFAAEVERQSDA